MIPSEIKIGNRARLTITSDGVGYAYGVITDFDGEDVLLEMDCGTVICVPWEDIIDAESSDLADYLTNKLVINSYLADVA